MTRVADRLFGSSTFRRAVGWVVLAWLFAAAAVWFARGIQPMESVRLEAREVQGSIEKALAEFAKREAELRLQEADGEAGFSIDYPDSARFDQVGWTLLSFAQFLRETEVGDWLEKEDYCWQLLDVRSTWFAGNRSTSPNAEQAIERFEIHGHTLLLVSEGTGDLAVQEAERASPSRAAWPRSRNREREHCLVQEFSFADGSRLRLGRPFAPFRLQKALLATGLLLVLSLASGLYGSYRIGRQTTGFLADLDTVRARLEGGGSPRLRRHPEDVDFDGAAQQINAILDLLGSALKTLTHVTDNIAHDLRTPLTRLQGQLDLLRRSPMPTEEMIGALQLEADQLVATFNALLRIAQVERGDRKQGFRPFDLAQVVCDVAELYAPAFADCGMPFVYRVPDRPVERFGDPDLWMQTLSNLIDNALKYNAEGGEVRLIVDDDEPPRILLQDSGPGILESERERVFDRFYRSERHQSEVRGSGLGLSLVRAVCNLHKATIRLDGGDGLTVEITWPDGEPSRVGGSVA